LKLAGTKSERLDLVYAREPLMHLRGDTFPTTRTLPPHPLQRLGQRLAAEALRLLLLRKLANGEVRLLLAGASFTEGYTPDLHHRPMETWALPRPAWPGLPPRVALTENAAPGSLLRQDFLHYFSGEIPIAERGIRTAENSPRTRVNRGIRKGRGSSAERV
jgi:hypothetical protein